MCMCIFSAVVSCYSVIECGSFGSCHVVWNYFYAIKIIFDVFEIFVQAYKGFISYYFLKSIQNESLKKTHVGDGIIVKLKVTKCIKQHKWIISSTTAHFYGLCNHLWLSQCLISTVSLKSNDTKAALLSSGLGCSQQASVTGHSQLLLVPNN